MSDTISYQDKTVEVIVNKRLKHSYISISRDRVIVVKTPYRSQQFVINLLQEKSTWIEKQFLKISNTVVIEDELLHSKESLTNRVEQFSKASSLFFTKLKFRKMRSRWGSCNSKREITLNSELLKLPLELVDYVIVHELAHTKHMNHSKEFHALVEKYLPDSKESRKKLKNIRLT